MKNRVKKVILIKFLHFKIFDRTKLLQISSWYLNAIKCISDGDKTVYGLLDEWKIWTYQVLWSMFSSFWWQLDTDNANSIVHYIDGINMSPRMTLNDVIFRIGHRDVVTICPVAFFYNWWFKHMKTNMLDACQLQGWVSNIWVKSAS